MALNPNQTGYKAHCVQRGETFSVLFPTLKPKPGFNERRIFGNLEGLASSIQHNGFLKTNPIIVEWSPKDQCFYVIHGERRYLACELLVSRGIDPGPIWCMSENSKNTPLQQLFDQILTNTGEQFTLLEKGRLYRRIQAHDKSVTGAEISRRVGETKQAVSNALRLAKHAGDALVSAILSGKISCTTALTIIDSAGEDHSAQEQLLDQTLNAASATGKAHATPKHLPPAQPQEDDAPPPFIADLSETSDPSESSDPSDSSGPPENPSPADSTPDHTQSLAPADPGAMDRIKSAPTTNHDGSSGGPGEGYAKLETRHKKLEDLLDELDEDNCVPEFWQTAELIIDYLAGKHPISKIRQHLLHDKKA